mmetsp:Transcript_55905/g.161929  ORF Transcript_55905/g.161929 Transcript_55905/m.161929 type:complete len:220 (-) Transcript_55905:39-698(-)
MHLCSLGAAAPVEVAGPDRGGVAHEDQCAALEQCRGAVAFRRQLGTIGSCECHVGGRDADAGVHLEYHCGRHRHAHLSGPHQRAAGGAFASGGRALLAPPAAHHLWPRPAGAEQRHVHRLPCGHLRYAGGHGGGPEGRVLAVSAGTAPTHVESVLMLALRPGHVHGQLGGRRMPGLRGGHVDTRQGRRLGVLALRARATGRDRGLAEVFPLRPWHFLRH